MKVFISEHIDLVFMLIALCVFIFLVVRTIKKARKIDTEGIVASAVVSKIVEDNDPDSAGISYVTYVTFTDQDGTVREAAMKLTSRPENTVGQEVYIKYLPGNYKMVREFKG
ncbi:MAG: hypothetical protein IJ744_01410 [Lachnospiraceae bacterium]|nr:hypothetical protein [Lachnospiraceae bacterium]